jgi:SnoaL-like domain
MTDRDEIVETLTRLFAATDHHRWDELAAVLADPVTLDYTATQGGEPAALSPAEVVAAWRPMFESIDAHQHLVANHLVTIDGDGGASASASFIAIHQWRGETWTLGGDYEFGLRRAGLAWGIHRLRMTPVWQTGPGDLLARAQQAR